MKTQPIESSLDLSKISVSRSPCIEGTYKIFSRLEILFLNFFTAPYAFRTFNVSGSITVEKGKTGFPLTINEMVSSSLGMTL